MGFKTKAIVAVLLVAGIGGGAAYWTLGRDKASKSQLIKGTVERGNVRISVTATGTLEAVRTVQVGSQISGQVAALHADYNSIVRKGQLLAEIDPRTFQSQVLTEQAQNASVNSRLQSSQADLLNQEANLVQVQANLKLTQVANENSAVLYERAKQLMQRGLIPQTDLDTARLNAESAAAKVEQAQASIKQAEAQIRSRQAAIDGVRSDIVGAKAQLDRAQINLDLTKIYSPVDGVVISRSVDIGQTVAASLSAPTLFLIANDLTHMQVKANIDEADIGKITPDVRVSFSVDAYPQDNFTGQIAEVRLEPQTVQNVVTYGVIVSVENPQLKLKPGMTANLTMVVDEHDDVLTVPNAALRFNPPGLTQDEIKKMVDALPALPGPPPIPAGDAAAAGAAGGQRGNGGGNGSGGGFSGGQAPQGQPGEGQGSERPGRGGGGGNGGRGGRGGRGRGGNGGGENAAGTTANADGQTPQTGQGAQSPPSGGNGGGFSRGGNSGGNFGGGNPGGLSGGGNGGGFAAGGGGRGGNGGGGGGRGGRGGGGRSRPSVLWTQDPTTQALKPIRARLGLNDGTRSEVSGPDVKEGMEIIIGDLTASTTTQQQRPANNPLLPNIGGNNNRGRGGF